MKAPALLCGTPDFYIRGNRFQIPLSTFAESSSANVAKPPSEGGAEQTGKDVSRLGERRPPAEWGRRGSAPAGSRGWPSPDF